MHVHTLEACVCNDDNLGLLRAPTSLIRRAAKPAPSGPRTSSPIATRSAPTYRIEGSGFTARRVPIYKKSVPLQMPFGGRDPRAMPPIDTIKHADTFIPDATARYSREQLNVMRDRAAARREEITDPQTSVNGDGPAYELEMEASDANGINRAVADSKGGVPGVNAKATAGSPDSNLPLIALGALAYYLFF